MPNRFALSLLLGAALLGCAASPAARASTVFTNFGPGLAYDITSGNPVGNAFDGNTYAEADSFTVSSAGALQSLRLALSCIFSCTDPLSVYLATDFRNQPGTAVETFSVDGASLGPLGSNNAPVLLPSILMPQLNVGVTYWVAVASGLSNSVSWNLNSTGDTSAQAISTDNGSTWFAPSGNTPGALEVNETATPEPSTAALITFGLLLALFLRRRQARQMER